MKEIDFLPADFHEALRGRRQTRRNTLYLIALVLALGCLHLVNDTRLRAAEACLSALRSTGVEKRVQRDRLAGLRRARQSLERRRDLIGRLDDGRPVDAVIAEVSRLTSGSAAVRSLLIEAGTGEARVKEEADPVFAYGRLEVVLVGAAATEVDVGILWGRLLESPLFEQITLGFSRQRREGGGQPFEFEFRFAVRPGAVNH